MPLPDVRPLAIPEVVEVTTRRFGDERGYFTEVFNVGSFGEVGLPTRWVQDNQSLSAQIGTLRGLHFQQPPFAQAKLVRVVHGAILDVAVDIRRDSPAYGRWVSLVVSAKVGNQILVPAGFAHGFVTREPDTVVLYKVSAPYSGEHDRSIRFDDPAIGVDWQLDGKTPQLSAKDEAAPLLADSDHAFTVQNASEIPQ